MAFHCVFSAATVGRAETVSVGHDQHRHPPGHGLIQHDKAWGHVTLNPPPDLTHPLGHCQHACRATRFSRLPLGFQVRFVRLPGDAPRDDRAAVWPVP